MFRRTSLVKYMLTVSHVLSEFGTIFHLHLMLEEIISLEINESTVSHIQSNHI